MLDPQSENNGPSIRDQAAGGGFVDEHDATNLTLPTRMVLHSNPGSVPAQQDESGSSDLAVDLRNWLPGTSLALPQGQWTVDSSSALTNFPEDEG